MKFVIFGLSITSSWGNGHATLWRGLCDALSGRGHDVVFFEKDEPYYAAHRDLTTMAGAELVLYKSWNDAYAEAKRHVGEADVAMTTSYCPDALAASELILGSKVEVRCFYDLDTPITLDRLERGLPVGYIGPRGLRDFDLTLSYSGGESLHKLRSMLGARCVFPLYGSVDPDTHFPAPPDEIYRADLSYLGTFAAERQKRLEQLFVDPAKQMPDQRFLIGGSMYDDTFPWQQNIFFLSHVPVAEHSTFYSSTRLNLSVTRAAMASNGYCPSARLFEAAACACPTISDPWDGLDRFFEPGSQILVAETAEDTKAALNLSRAELCKIGNAARERTLDEHTAGVRAKELESILMLEVA